MTIEFALPPITFTTVEPEDDCLEAWSSSFLIKDEMYTLSFSLFDDAHAVSEVETTAGLPAGDGKGYLFKFDHIDNVIAQTRFARMSKPVAEGGHGRQMSIRVVRPLLFNILDGLHVFAQTQPDRPIIGLPNDKKLADWYQRILDLKESEVRRRLPSHLIEVHSVPYYTHSILLIRRRPSWV